MNYDILKSYAALTLQKKEQIIVLDYDPQWAIQFEELKNVLLNYLDSDNIEIEHIGSTSIKGLCAKPIIDLDIIINADERLQKEVIDKLSKLGYTHVGNLGISGREAFKKENSKTPNDGSGKDWFSHNLYLCQKGSIGLINHINFRNYLREYPSIVVAYGHLKKALAEKYPLNIDAYIDGKTNFIVDILSKTGMQKNHTKLIDNENRVK